MNKVVLTGRLTKDIEIRYTNSNKAYSSFSLAVNTGYGDNQRTDYIECVAWEKRAELLSKYCSKGSKLLIEGKIQTNSYDAPDGSKRYTTKVIVENLEFLENKSGNKENNEIKSTAENTAESAEDPFASFGEEIKDEDLPWNY